MFGFTVAQISQFDLGASANAEAVLDAFEAWCVARDVRLASCRLDHERLAESMALEELGFRFVETVYRPRFDRFAGVGSPRHPIEVAEATTADATMIEEIASHAFTTGRFLLDRRLAPELSDRRYATWVRRSFASPEQRIIKATLDGEIVGFFIIEARADRSVYWHLTAVAPASQGLGIGTSLWQTMLRRHAAEGASYVETTISGHNLAALNLYARLGFVFGSAQMTLHWLRNGDVLA